MFDLQTQILDMLADGKINASEASDLLKALDSDKSNCCNKKNRDLKKTLEKFSEHVESFTKDIQDKFYSTRKSLGPKAKNATLHVLKKTSQLINDISDKIEKSSQESCEDDEQ
jgi:hypothetical protein